ncbi:hypothetical protein D3C72_2433650 [compost metagenome]
MPCQLEAFAHRFATLERPAEQIGAGNGVELAIIGHEAHQGVDIVTVPGLAEGLQKFGAHLGLGHFVLLRHC